MSAVARRIHPFGEIKVNVPAGTSCGDVVELPDGRAAVVVGLNLVANADGTFDATCIYTGIYEVPAASATTFAAGVTVDWDASAGDNGEAIATGGVGDFVMGLVVRAKTASQLVVLVDLNAQ